MNELVNSISISNSGDIKNTNLFPPPIPQNIPSFQFSILREFPLTFHTKTLMFYFLRYGVATKRVSEIQSFHL